MAAKELLGDVVEEKELSCNVDLKIKIILFTEMSLDMEINKISNIAKKFNGVLSYSNIPQSADDYIVLYVGNFVFTNDNFAFKFIFDLSKFLSLLYHKWCARDADYNPVLCLKHSSWKISYCNTRYLSR